MRRRIFNVLSALSLLLFAAVVVMWVRSQFVSDSLVWRTEQVDRRDGRVWNVIESRLVSSRGWWSHVDYSDAGAADTFDPALQDHAQHSADRRSFAWQTQSAPVAIRFWATRFGGETPGCSS